MVRWQRFVIPAVLALAVGLVPARARASVTLNFTDAINFNYTAGTGNISDLGATVTFTVSGSTLTIDVNNLSTTSEIAGVFFNAPSAGTFSNTQVVSSNPVQVGLTANASAGGQADGFGNFGYELTFGSSQAGRLNTSTEAIVTATFSGSITDADLQTTTHSGTYGDNAGVIDWKPTAGLTGFGSGNPGPSPAAPEPSTIVMAASGGLVGLVYWWRRRRPAA
jgi:hypothetical protein